MGHSRIHTRVWMAEGKHYLVRWDGVEYTKNLGGQGRRIGWSVGYSRIQRKVWKVEREYHLISGIQQKNPEIFGGRGQ